MASFPELFRSLSPDEHRRGREFERICKWFLEHDPQYRRLIKRVWLWDDWPGRWGRDKGIDRAPVGARLSLGEFISFFPGPF